MSKLKTSLLICGISGLAKIYFKFEKQNIDQNIEFHRDFNNLSQAIKKNNISYIISHCGKPDPRDRPIYGIVPHQINSTYSKFIAQRDADCALLKQHMILANTIRQNYDNFDISNNNNDADYLIDRILNENEDIREELSKLSNIKY